MAVDDEHVNKRCRGKYVNSINLLPMRGRKPESLAIKIDWWRWANWRYSNWSEDKSDLDHFVSFKHKKEMS
jgi:hypothetical protein